MAALAAVSTNGGAARAEDRKIDKAIKALGAGDPQPVMDLAAAGIIPTDAPVVEEARKAIDGEAPAAPKAKPAPKAKAKAAASKPKQAAKPAAKAAKAATLGTAPVGWYITADVDLDAWAKASGREFASREDAKAAVWEVGFTAVELALDAKVATIVKGEGAGHALVAHRIKPRK